MYSFSLHPQTHNVHPHFTLLHNVLLFIIFIFILLYIVLSVQCLILKIKDSEKCQFIQLIIKTLFFFSLLSNKIHRPSASSTLVIKHFKAQVSSSRSLFREKLKIKQMSIPQQRTFACSFNICTEISQEKACLFG